MKPQIRKIGKERTGELEEFLSLSTPNSSGFEGVGSVPILMVEAGVVKMMMDHIESTNKMLKRMMANPTRLWLSHAETCDFLGVSDNTLRDYRDRGLIAFSQRERQIWFHFDDIEEFLLHQRKEAFQYKS